MDKLRKGYQFFIQSWKMAFADRDLLKPTIYAMIVGFVVSIIGLVPTIAVGFLLGDSTVGQVVTFVLGALLIFSQYTVSYVFSAMTIYLIYGYLSEGDGRMDKAWAVAKRDFFDILKLSAASTVVKLIENGIRGKDGGSGRRAAANFLNTIWTEATYLILPAMVIEDIGLRDGLKRATQIVKDNLLLVGVSTVGVGFVTGILGFILGGIGIALGFGVGFGLVTVLGGSPIGFIAGISLGGSIAIVFILLAVMISRYTATAYHTSLYLWARDVEKAQEAGQAGTTVAAPAPLASVL
jgi:hypothetical protein